MPAGRRIWALKSEPCMGLGQNWAPPNLDDKCKRWCWASNFVFFSIATLRHILWLGGVATRRSESQWRGQRLFWGCLSRCCHQLQIWEGDVLIHRFLNVTWVFDVFAISFFQLLGSLTLPTSLHQRVLYIAFYIPASEPVWTAGGFFLHLLLHSLHGVFDCTQILLPCIFLDMPTGSVQPIPSWWGCLWLWHFCAFCSGIGQNLWHDSAKHCRPGGPTQVNPKWLTPKLRCCEIKVANHVWVAKAHCSPLGP